MIDNETLLKQYQENYKRNSLMLMGALVITFIVSIVSWLFIAIKFMEVRG